MHEKPSCLQDGLISARPWSSAYEGPFTQLAKVATLNALPARDLCRMLFGRSLLHHHGRPWHGRSLLSDTWLRAIPLRSTLTAEIARRTLEHLCGVWTSSIASDAHLRYCPVCLRGGFQSAVYQIDALRVCPIHNGQPLLEVCPHCAAPTAAYAVTVDGFDRPFHCHACGGPLACNADAAHWERTWRAPRGVQALQPLIAWLRAIKCAPLQWPDVGVWELDPRGNVDRERRCSVFSVLRKVVPLKSSIQTEAPLSLQVYRDAQCPSSQARLLMLDDPVSIARRAIYKSMRRHFRKSLAIDTAQRAINMRDFAHEGSVQALIPPPTLQNSALHGFLLWRQRFEEDFRGGQESAGAPWANPLRLRPPMAHWPVVRDVSHGFWARFALECLHEDLWTAQQWLEASTVERTDVPKIARSAAELARLNVWKYRMSAEIFPWPMSLTHLTLNGTRAEGTLLFVAPVRGDAGLVVHVDHGGELLPAEDDAHRASPRSPCHVMPLERLVLPAHLDGSDGRYRVRGEPCRINASNDRDAVQAWLLASGVAASTATVYRLAGERLLNWCCIEKGKPLSSLDREDFAEFARFLAHPTPVDRWIGPRAPRDTQRWRPFTQPPSPSTCAFMMACVKALLHWLAEQRYAELRVQASRQNFERDGISDVPTTYHRRKISQSEPLEIDEWQWIRRALDDVERNGTGLPIRLLVELMYYAGLSWEQISKLTFSSVGPAKNDDDWRVWILRGKSDDGVYPVAAPPPLARTLRTWLLSHRSMDLHSLLSQPLLPIDLAPPTRLIRSLMTDAAAHAEAAGHHAIAARLAHRSARALKKAFSLHEQILLGGRKAAAVLSLTDASNRARNLAHRWAKCESLWASVEPVKAAANGAAGR